MLNATLFLWLLYTGSGQAPSVSYSPPMTMEACLAASQKILRSVAPQQIVMVGCFKLL